MKFPRHARPFTGRLDAAPFAGIFFCLLLLLLLAGLVRTPGVKLELPAAEGLPGAEVPAVAVAVDIAGRLFFENQPITAERLRERLSAIAGASKSPLTVIVMADKAVQYETLLGVTSLVRECGVRQIHLATLPRPRPPKSPAP